MHGLEYFYHAARRASVQVVDVQHDTLNVESGRHGRSIGPIVRRTAQVTQPLQVIPDKGDNAELIPVRLVENAIFDVLADQVAGPHHVDGARGLVGLLLSLLAVAGQGTILVLDLVQLGRDPLLHVVSLARDVHDIAELAPGGGGRGDDRRYHDGRHGNHSCHLMAASDGDDGQAGQDHEQRRYEQDPDWPPVEELPDQQCRRPRSLCHFVQVGQRLDPLRRLRLIPWQVQ